MIYQNCYPAKGRACVCISRDDNGPVHITVTRIIEPPADAATDRLIDRGRYIDGAIVWKHQDGAGVPDHVIARCVAAALADWATI